MSKSAKLYAIHIIECIEKINQYTGGEKEKFLSDAMVYDAVVRNLQTLAESAGRIYPKVKEQHPEIELKKVNWFRNILVHDYLGDIDPNVLWNVIVNYLPQIKAVLLAEYDIPTASDYL